MAERLLDVLDVGLQCTVQDLGRPGLAHLGVPRSGAVDQPALRLANRLVGNPESAAGLECLDGRLRVRPSVAATVAVTGARVPVRVDGRPAPWGQAVTVRAGAVIDVGAPTWGLRAYLAVAGGLDVPKVLGSRSTDQLSGLGPEPVAEGTPLQLGPVTGPPRPVDVPPRSASAGPEPGGVVRLGLRLGPRADLFDDDSLERLGRELYAVSSTSNRIGLRLEGRALRRTHEGELPSEGMVLGAVQVPPSGQPVVFLHDHPTTGGYPVIGVVEPDDLSGCAQLRPGERVGFRVLR